MAPKRTLSQSSYSSSKRTKLKSGAESARSETPHETTSAPSTPFTVAYVTVNPASKKKLSRAEAKRNEELVPKAEVLTSPFPELVGQRKKELDGHYAVLPNDVWSSLKAYSNCLIQTKTYKTGEYVFVRSETTSHLNEHDIKQFWVAKILQIRAKDPQNVYALITWLYWPHELPPLKGRREQGALPYHGTHEVIASNYLEVVEVLSFAGHANITYWDETSDVITSQLYWRQTFARDTQELSAVKEHCICHGHFNPDPEKSMYICDNTACGLWIHKECIIHQVLSEAYDRLTNSSSATANGASKKKQTKMPYDGLLSGEVIEGDTTFEVEVTDRRAGKGNAKKTETACCLKCRTNLLR